MRWTLNDINWQSFAADEVDPDLVCVVKTAALVEANSADYVAYLINVFPNDLDFHAAAEQWGLEEAQHGAALARWAELADPSFSVKAALTAFRAGYQLDLATQQSVRGSRLAELIARCVVESGTSSFYSAIRDISTEPVLKQIGRHMAADEFAHYQLFQKYAIRYERQEPLSRLTRIKVAVSRVQEAEDKELAYAFFAANVLPNNPNAHFDVQAYSQAYYRLAMGLYQREHIDTATRMILRAARFQPRGMFANLASHGFWRFVQFKRRKMQKAA